MNELLPYEEQLAGKLANIPLPGEDMSWHAMLKKLDDDGDVIIPPVNNGCRIWGVGLLLVLLVISTIAVVYKMTQKNANGPKIANSTLIKKDSIESFKSLEDRTNKKVINSDTISTAGDRREKASTLIIAEKKGEVKIVKTPAISTKKDDILMTKTGQGQIGTKRESEAGLKDAAKQENVKEIKVGTLQKPRADSASLSSPLTGQTTNAQEKPMESRQTITHDTATKQLTVAGKQPVSKKDSSIQKALKDDEDEPANKIWFGAGLSLQQLIPVDGQKAVPYNAFGRKGSLGDYIPSIYFRAYQGRKFLQVEFRYGAPQYTKDIAYGEKVLHFDSTTNIKTASVNHVKKTYYNQLPISFHYGVLPNFSVGAGFVWNRFNSAVVEQKIEHSQGSVITDSVSSPGQIVDIKSDTSNSFAKSYFQFMLETQYTWKRLSFGARYSWGIQPYITFTVPLTGQTQKERNASLQIFLRYELWRSKKK